MSGANLNGVKRMYFLTVAALLFLFPLASILAQTLLDAHGMPTAIMAARWFAFWRRLG
jgi:hypothetical protein